MKKMKLNERVFSILLAGAISLSLTGCSGNVKMNKKSFDQLLSIEEIQDHTLLDELVREKSLMYEDELSILDAADRLEEYMDIEDLLKNVSFEGITPSEELYLLPKYEVVFLLDLLKEKDNSPERLEVKQAGYSILYAFHQYCKEWIHEN